MPNFKNENDNNSEENVKRMKGISLLESWIEELV